MPGETKPAAGRMDSRNADAPAFKRGGVRAVQQVSPNRMGDRCAPHHVRRRTRQRPGLNERSISSILREHILVNNRTEHTERNTRMASLRFEAPPNRTLSRGSGVSFFDWGTLFLLRIAFRVMVTHLLRF